MAAPGAPLCPVRPPATRAWGPRGGRKKDRKNFKKRLDTHGVVLYDSGALLGAQSAMMREIAAQAGNFRGVCPFESGG